MKFNKGILFLLVGFLALAMAACAPSGNVPDTGTDGTNTVGTDPKGDLPPAAVLSAQEWLATNLGVDVSSIQIVEIEQTEWQDSCLGLGGPAESCLQVIVPGFRAVFDVNGDTYEVRTDADGMTIRSPQIQNTP